MLTFTKEEDRIKDWTMVTFIAISTVLVVMELPVFQGNIRISADYAVAEDSSGRRVVEFFYEIPYSGFTFVRSADGFVARYRMTVEALDRFNRVTAADVWEQEVSAASYPATVSPDSFARGTVRFPLPQGTAALRVAVYDRLSERQAVSRFVPAVRGRGARLRFLKSGRMNPSRTYTLNDTVEIEAEFPLPPAEWSGSDSVLWFVKKGGRVLNGARTGVVREPDRLTARFVVPVTDSGHLTSSGSYTVEARLLSGAGSGEAEFQVKLPFYYDDSLWNARVEQLVYIASHDEMRRLKRTARSRRQAAWAEFWQDKDPNPSTPVNEQEQEYFARIEYCEQNFGRGDRGYRSDRGRIYVLYGPPDQIESRPFEIDRPAEEIWYYYQRNLTFVFVDRYGSGEFVLWRR